MFIIDVIPLTNLPVSQPQILSYFFKSDLKRGSMVEIPLGRRNVMASVLNSAPVYFKKAVLKKADFTLRPINKVVSYKPIVPQLFFLLADFISRYYFCPISLCLKIILPRRIKSLINYLEKKDFPKYFESPGATKVKNKIHYTGSFSEVIKKIKDCLKDRKQILVLVPTAFYQNYYFSKLSSEISQPLFIASNDLKVKEFNSLWTKVNSQEAQLIIGRRSAPFLPWRNLGFIVVIEANNTSYKSWDQKPYYNSTTVINYLASYYNAKIIYYNAYYDTDC